MVGNDVFTMGVVVDAAEGLELGLFDVAEGKILGVVELEGVGLWLGFTEGDGQASQVSAQFKITSSRRQ